MSRRATTPEEREEFAAAFAETRPLASRTKTAPAKRTAIASTSGGLDGRTSERLRRGLIEPDSRLDLHGFTEESAHAALRRLLRSARLRGDRLLLIVTGRGKRKDSEGEMTGRGILRTLVPRWLAEPEFAGQVAAISAAHRRHGGDGALYVYLRKPRG